MIDMFALRRFVQTQHLAVVQVLRFATVVERVHRWFRRLAFIVLAGDIGLMWFAIVTLGPYLMVTRRAAFNIMACCLLLSFQVIHRRYFLQPLRLRIRFLHEELARLATVLASMGVYV